MLPKRAPLAAAVALALGILPARLSTAEPDRTAPTPLVSAVRELERFAKQKGGVVSLLVERAKSGEELGHFDAERMLNPASNQKLFTAAFALDALGASFRFRTQLLGAIDGSKVPTLVLRSRGNPTLSSEDLAELARGLKQQGVTRVEVLAIDQSYFDGAFVPPAFEQQPNEWAAFRAPVSAVAVDGNAVTLHVKPTSPGNPATVWFEPVGFVDVKGQVTTRAEGKAPGVKLELFPGGPRLSAKLGGELALPLGDYRLSRRVDDPRLFAGYVLRHHLQAQGIAVPREPVLGGESETRELVGVDSPPLAEILPALGKRSDNFTAEMLLKVIGAQATKKPGSSADGAKLISSGLDSRGEFPQGAKVGNGSGLFDANRASAREIVALLRRVYGDSRLAPDYLSQLSIAGIDGTASSRLKRYALCGCIRVKTGTLRSADALSGYVLSPNGNDVVFSILVNGVTNAHADVHVRMDAVVDAIVAGLGDP
jgi:serine-type D-Ala-D-Ala carboxypeptidase/endopeptidase (penicillin-binding protein 4)